MSQNVNSNKLDYIYLIQFEKQYGSVCEGDYSSKLQKYLGRFLLNCVNNPLLSEQREFKGFSNTLKIDLSLS